MSEMTMADFADFKLTMPTEAEMRQSSLLWFDRVGHTLIDKWPAELAALSMPTKMVKFPFEIFEDLFEPKGELPGHEIVEFANELDAKIGWQRQFIRLNSRSPKDSPWPFEVPATISGKEAVNILSCSERVLDDLCRFRYIPEHPAFVCLREFLPQLRSQYEYRCFVRDGELIAVSHYDYTKPWSGPSDGGKELRRQIESWFADILRPTLPSHTIVFDIFQKRDGFLLIEINPYGLSDPCHFKSYDRVENATGFVEYAPSPTPEA